MCPCSVLPDIAISCPCGASGYSRRARRNASSRARARRVQRVALGAASSMCVGDRAKPRPERGSVTRRGVAAPEPSARPARQLRPASRSPRDAAAVNPALGIFASSPSSRSGRTCCVTSEGLGRVVTERGLLPSGLHSARPAGDRGQAQRARRTRRQSVIGNSRRSGALIPPPDVADM